MLLYTDGRSGKNAELLRQPAVEICWLLAKARQQYRFRGTVALCSIAQDADHCSNHWRQLSLEDGRCGHGRARPALQGQCGVPDRAG